MADVEILGTVFSHEDGVPKVPIGVEYSYVTIGVHRFAMDLDGDDGAAAKFMGLITDAVFRALAYERDCYEEGRRDDYEDG